MTVDKTPIEGLLVFTPRIFPDNRGHFFESFNQRLFEEAVGKPVRFVQDNQSLSHRGVLRGLHFQAPPHAQGKLVRVLHGAVLDVAVDIRTGSATYGRHFSIELTAENRRQLWIPEGFAHGFVSLEEQTIFAYKCTDYYAPSSEGTIRWNDPQLGIDWRISDPFISEKDNNSLIFHNFPSPFQ